jgi:hypothetical protein
LLQTGPSSWPRRSRAGDHGSPSRRRRHRRPLRSVLNCYQICVVYGVSGVGVGSWNLTVNRENKGRNLESEVFSQGGCWYLYAHVFNYLIQCAFSLMQIQNRLFSMSSLPLKPTPVRRFETFVTRDYTYVISTVNCMFDCNVPIFF